MSVYVRNLEAAYARMWDRWRAGEPPAAFAVGRMTAASEATRRCDAC